MKCFYCALADQTFTETLEVRISRMELRIHASSLDIPTIAPSFWLTWLKYRYQIVPDEDYDLTSSSSVSRDNPCKAPSTPCSDASSKFPCPCSSRTVAKQRLRLGFLAQPRSKFPHGCTSIRHHYTAACLDGIRRAQCLCMVVELLNQSPSCNGRNLLLLKNLAVKDPGHRRAQYPVIGGRS